MKLHALSDQDLHVQTVRRAQDEKLATLALLEHLLEVDRRDLAFKLGFRSLWEFVHRGLGYSESAASERVAAMRLLRRSSKAVELLRDQKLSLTVAARVQHFARAAEKAGDPVNVDEVLAQVTGCSKREADRLLASKNPSAAMPYEYLRALSDQFSELKVVLDMETLALLAESRELFLAPNFSEALRRALKYAVAHKKHAMNLKNKALQSGGALPEQGTFLVRNTKQKQARYIPTSLKRALLERAQHQCEYVGTLGRCRERAHLHFDHRIPRARGGLTTFENLRVLCAQHNWAESRAAGLGDYRRL